jgi:hypothetical protein
MLAEARMNKILLIVLMAVVVGCNQCKQTYSIAEVTKSKTIVLNKLSSQGHIHGISIVGNGHLDGTAEIVLILNGKSYKVETLSGGVNFKWGGDWYSDSATIEYKPSSVKRGYLKLEYRFEDM